MTTDEKRRALALYRLSQADEALDEAKYLLEGQKSPRVIINRVYYSMFYAVLALLVFEEFASSKHSGVLAYFNQRYIKSGRISKDIGRSINLAFELRQQADYREFNDLSYDQVSVFIPQAQAFVATVRTNLNLL